MKRVRDNVIESEYVEWGVEYQVDGETFTYEALDEDDARLVRASLNGTLLAKQVFETAWATATLTPDDAKTIASEIGMLADGPLPAPKSKDDDVPGFFL